MLRAYLQKFLGASSASTSIRKPVRCTYRSCDKFKDLVHTIVCIKSTPMSFPWLAQGFEKLLLGLCGLNHTVLQGFCRCLAGVETSEYRLGYFSQAAPELMGMNPGP